jgi:hypothetical protein
MAWQKTPVAGITIEWDDKKHPRLEATDGKWDKHDIRQSKNKDDEFTPKRIVADLKLNLGDASKKTVDLVDVHLKYAYQGAKPTLGYWNGAKWVKFEDTTVTYKDGIADVTLPSPWPTDPPIGTSP